MREIKIKYVVNRKNGHVFSEIFTMKQIELGEALRFLEVNHAREMDVFKFQYTGIKDKKGKEIYEGDKCNIIYHDGQSEEMIVIWDKIKACFYFVDCYMDCFTITSTPIEIIGNIHQEQP